MNPSTSVPIEPRAVSPAVSPTLSPEDAARARWYATLAELFRAPPSATQLQAMAAHADGAGDVEAAGDAASALGRAWDAFARACAQADARSVREEYDTAFIGVGKADVFLYASWHLTGFLHERPLAELREHLAGLGIARRAQSSETEDHVAALCETMAWLIVAAPDAVRTLETQREFFTRFLLPWHESLADAIAHSGVTDFYKHVARLMREFFAIEREAFDFESSD